MTSMTAYADARYYVREAQASSVHAARALSGALGVWQAAKQAAYEARLSEQAAQRSVQLYDAALYQLGVAEYTGQTAVSGTNLAAQEHEVEVAQLGEVAASDTDAGLAHAQKELALAHRQVSRTYATVAATKVAAEHARRLFGLAQEQWAISRRVVLEARRWATVAGKAPAQPVQALVKLEGPLAPPLHAAWVVFLLPTTTSTTTTTLPLAANGVPLSPKCPLTTLALPPAGVDSDSALTVATASSTGPSTTSLTTAPGAPATAAGAAAAGPVLPSTGVPVALATPSSAGASSSEVSSMAAPPLPAPARTASSAPEPTTTVPGPRLDCNPPNLSTAGPTIMGPSLLNASQIEGWFESTEAVPNVTVPFDRLVNDYLKVGRLTGVRADIAFAQSIVETGYFSFPSYGQDPRGYNNFAGIGACDSCKHGFRFGSAMGGVMAQEELLGNYAAPSEMMSGPGGGTNDMGVFGCCQTWMGLSGVWATNPNYGFAILSVYKLMLQWALRSELHMVGLGPAQGLASSTQPVWATQTIPPPKVPQTTTTTTAPGTAPATAATATVATTTATTTTAVPAARATTTTVLSTRATTTVPTARATTTTLATRTKAAPRG